MYLIDQVFEIALDLLGLPICAHEGLPQHRVSLLVLLSLCVHLQNLIVEVLLIVDDLLTPGSQRLG